MYQRGMQASPRAYSSHKQQLWDWAMEEGITGPQFNTVEEEVVNGIWSHPDYRGVVEE
jgi:hypothetical protein